MTSGRNFCFALMCVELDRVKYVVFWRSLAKGSDDNSSESMEMSSAAA